MGCFLSTTKSSKAENYHYPPEESCKHGQATPHPPPRSPPPVEETVKEVVLSETRKQKGPPLEVKEKNVKKGDEQDSEVQQVRSESTLLTKPEMRSTTLVKPAEEIICEVSEHSEMWSVTESLSTTTAPDKREEDGDGEVTQRSPARVPRKRRSSGEVTGAREKGVRSPARTPATARRGQVASLRAGQGRQVTAQRRNVGPVHNHRQDTGERLGRRSRSPVTRGNLGTSQNVRHKNPSLSETSRADGRSPVTIANHADEEEKRDDVVSPENSESFENPVVSLECFIFI